MVEELGRHILVVEDETVIACLLADVFGAGGYRVTTCPTVAEGLAAVRTHRDIALCISDFLLPDRTGLDFAREVSRLRPELRIVLASAFLETEIEEAVARVPSVALVIRKPLDVFDLRARVDALVAAIPKPGETSSAAACD
ncbi:MAG: response regulator [Planctomycetes bacterium]|nr:response regulator [Planctomycetota bacterium]